MGAQTRLRTRIAILVAIGALLVAVGVALLLSNTVGLRGSADSAISSDAYLLRANDVERLVVDVETGLRGYLLTGRPLFLEPLHRAQAGLPAATTALRRESIENRAFEPQADTLITTSRSYLSDYVTPVLALAARDPHAAQSFALTFAGKQRVDAIRGQAAALEQLVSARQTARQRAARGSANQSIAEAIVALVLLTLLTAVLGGVLGHVAVDRERARERSEQTSRTLQESLLPSRLPEIPDCELAARFVPAAGLVGGDFYDAFETEPGSWAIILGDVCGKGPAAAAVTAMARWRLRTSLESGASVGDAMRSLNDAMLRQNANKRFLTAACITVTVEPDVAHVEVVCAGHPSPVFVPAEGAPEPVGARGDLLGVLSSIRLHGQKLELRAGESLVAFTDGVADYGPEPGSLFERTLGSREVGGDAQQLAELLEEVARRRPGPHRDDVAVVSLRFVGDLAARPEPVVAARNEGADND